MALTDDRWIESISAGLLDGTLSPERAVERIRRMLGGAAFPEAFIVVILILYFLPWAADLSFPDDTPFVEQALRELADGRGFGMISRATQDAVLQRTQELKKESAAQKLDACGAGIASAASAANPSGGQ